MRKRFVGIQSLTGKNWLGTHIRKHHVHDRHFEKKVRDANYGEELSEAEKDARVASPQQKPQRQQDERPPQAIGELGEMLAHGSVPQQGRAHPAGERPASRLLSPQRSTRQQAQEDLRAFIAQLMCDATILNIIHTFGNFLGNCYMKEFIAQVTLRPHFATKATLLALTGQSHCSLEASFYKPHQLNSYLSCRDDVDIEWDLVPRSGNPVLTGPV